MRASFVSTATLLDTPRSGIARMQNDLVRLSREVVTGRMADIGLNLGAGAARSVTLHVDTGALDALARSNATLATRLQQTQTALDSIRSAAGAFLGDLATAKTAPDPALIAANARSALSAFIGQANASDGGDRLFGGINSGVAPLASYDSGPGAAVDAAFQAAFGFAPGDPASAGIGAAAMTAFLDGAFAELFADPAWGATWSTATDQLASSRISLTEKVTSSASANDPAMRKLAAVYTMVGHLGMEALGPDARQAVLDKAIALIDEAASGIIDLQAGIGTVQNQVKDASARIAAQQTILATRIGALEGVDPAEAKVRIDMLTTQIEMSYSLTVRLLQMSILNYV